MTNESYPATLGIFLPGTCVVAIKGDCWVLAEVCALLSAVVVLFNLVTVKRRNVTAKTVF